MSPSGVRSETRIQLNASIWAIWDHMRPYEAVRFRPIISHSLRRATVGVLLEREHHSFHSIDCHYK